MDNETLVRLLQQQQQQQQQLFAQQHGVGNLSGMLQLGQDQIQASALAKVAQQPTMENPLAQTVLMQRFGAPMGNIDMQHHQQQILQQQQLLQQLAVMSQVAIPPPSLPPMPRRGHSARLLICDLPRSLSSVPQINCIQSAKQRRS
jgi:hypothetical protein